MCLIILRISWNGSLNKITFLCLQVLSRQEVIRQQGCSLSAEEEGFRCALEKLWNDMVVPCGSKSRLQEMLSTIRMGEHAFRRDTGGVAGGPNVQFDSETTSEIRDVSFSQISVFSFCREV